MIKLGGVTGVESVLAQPSVSEFLEPQGVSVNRALVNWKASSMRFNLSSRRFVASR